MATEEITGVADAEAGTITVKEGDADVQYVKAASLKEVTDARDELQSQIDKTDTTKSAETKEAEGKAAEANQQKLQSEAKVEKLEEQIKEHTGTAEELTRLKGELGTAQTAAEETTTELLTLRRAFMISKYKVPPETVNEKSLEQLKVFEEALKAVIGASGGNYAFGSAGGGANALEGKSPMELAQMAYAEK